MAWTDEAREASARARREANGATNAALKATKGVASFKGQRQLEDIHHAAANLHTNAALLSRENEARGTGGTADQNYHTKMAEFHRLAANHGSFYHGNDAGMPVGATAEVASRHADLQFGDGHNEVRTRVENAAMLHTLASKDPNSDSYLRGMQRKRGASMREQLKQIPKESKIGSRLRAWEKNPDRR